MTTWTAKDGRKFALPVGAAFLVLMGIALWRHPHAITWKVLASLGGAFILLGLAIPAQLQPLHKAWMGMAHAISKVTTPIFMGVVYFVIVTPIGVLMRLFGRNSMVQKEQNGSFWMPAPSGGRSDLTHQF